MFFSFFFSFPGDQMQIDDEMPDDLSNSNSLCVFYVTIKSSRAATQSSAEATCLVSVLISLVFHVVT